MTVGPPRLDTQPHAITSRSNSRAGVSKKTGLGIDAVLRPNRQDVLEQPGASKRVPAVTAPAKEPDSRPATYRLIPMVGAAAGNAGSYSPGAYDQGLRQLLIPSGLCTGAERTAVLAMCDGPLARYVPRPHLPTIPADATRSALSNVRSSASRGYSRFGRMPRVLPSFQLAPEKVGGEN